MQSQQVQTIISPAQPQKDDGSMVALEGGHKGTMQGSRADLDGVGLDQLRAVLQRVRRDVFPGSALGHAQVHMGGRQLVNMKPAGVQL